MERRKQHIEETIEFKEQDAFIEYTVDKDYDFKPTERVYENDIILLHLGCSHEGCKTYIKGLEYYNGGFISENGARADLRNQGFTCLKHK